MTISPTGTAAKNPIPLSSSAAIMFHPHLSMVRRLSDSVLESSEGTRVFPEPSTDGGLEYRVSRQYRVVAFVGFPFQHLCTIVIVQCASGDLAVQPREQSRGLL